MAVTTTMLVIIHQRLRLQHHREIQEYYYEQMRCVSNIRRSITQVESDHEQSSRIYVRLTSSGCCNGLKVIGEILL